MIAAKNVTKVNLLVVKNNKKFVENNCDDHGINSNLTANKTEWEKLARFKGLKSCG